MPADSPTVLATSGGYRRGDRTPLAFDALVRHALDLSGATGRPRLAYLGTAHGDQTHRLALVQEAARETGVDLVPVTLFTMPNHADPAAALLSVDAVWVDGGSVANLLALWRLHGLDDALREAWQAGVVLAGVSAGSICWFTGGTTDSFGPGLRPVTNGLGLLPYANGVHYDTEERRRPLVHRLVGEGVLGETHCTDDGVGLVYSGTTLVEAVTERDGPAAAYRVVREGGEGGEGGTVIEERIEPRRLP